MAIHRKSLPQLSGELFLCDGGVETDLIFNHGIEICEFASHTLLKDENGRKALADYFRSFLRLARESGTGFILDSQTWKAHRHWADDLGATKEELKQANLDSIAFIAGLRAEFQDKQKPIVLNALIGPRGDAYAPDSAMAAHEAEEYHAEQIDWLAGTDVDMVTATTFTQSDEAIGVVRAAQKVGLPAVVSFTVETDGNLPTGQALSDAIEAVDQATADGPAYFMVNCAHPEHFMHLLSDTSWSHRIHGLRCNASRKSHAELDQSETLSHGYPVELAILYKRIRTTMPWLNVFGGCCGSDLSHVVEIARVMVG